MTVPGQGSLIAPVTMLVASAAKRSSSSRKKSVRKPVYRPCKRHLTLEEVEATHVYRTIESYLYRMCIKEVPFFLALHRSYYRDPRLDKRDTLVLRKQVLQSLLFNASNTLNTSELTISPVINIDSMMIFRPKVKNGKTTRCNMIIYTVPGAYEIPKTGAKVSVPGVLRGTVARNTKTGSILVTIFSKGVKLQLPHYAKVLSLGMISDIDVRYAELLPAGNGFEARLLYAAKEKQVKKRGWSLNVTECNKIRPYAR
jgi:hypothetical protein